MKAKDIVRQKIKKENLHAITTHYGDFELIGPVRLPLKLLDGSVKYFVQYLFAFAPEPHNRWGLLYSEEHGLPEKEAYVRIQSMCIWSHIFDSQYCDCRWQLEAAKQYISQHGGVILFGFDQNGKGIGIEGHFRVYGNAQIKDLELVVAAYEKSGYREDYRTYDRVADILNILGIKKIKLLAATNSPRRLAFFKENGFIIERVPHYIQDVSSYLKEEYAVKKEKLNHLL
jgi:GTP cyclohydrolase II